jgi:hypothetical protein
VDKRIVSKKAAYANLPAFVYDDPVVRLVKELSLIRIEVVVGYDFEDVFRCFHFWLCGVLCGCVVWFCVVLWLCAVVWCGC